jgi:WXG100 family type VII secretion target
MAINFNYNQTVNQAKLLDELANDVQNQCCKKMGEISENIEAAWSGDAAAAYKKYVNGVRDDLLKKAKYMRDTAEFLRTTAKRMRDADAAAKQAAQRAGAKG